MTENNKIEYYNTSRVLSCNRIFNFILGGRGIGKSFAWKDYVIKKFIENKWQFVYSRRYQIDIDKTAPYYFDDISQKYAGHVFKYQGGIFYIDGEVAGYAIAVSQYIKLKSVSYPDVFTILFDEFITENCDYIGGIKNPLLEPELCLNFYQTIARGYNQPVRTNVKFVFISNAVSINNPHFLYYDLDKKLINGGKFLLTDSICLEIAESKSIKETIENTQLGKLIKGTRYGNYSLNNEFYLDSNEFVNDDIPKHCRYVFTISYDKWTLGVWKDENEGMYYITEKYDPNCLIHYSLNNNSHKTNTILIQQNKNKPSVKLLRLAYETGFVRFQNQRCKNILLTFLGL